MSVRIIDWAMDQDLPPFHRFVLVVLGDCSGPDGTCFPSIRHICRRTGMSERTVQRVLRDLEASRIITHSQNERHRWTFKINHDLPLVVSAAEMRGRGAPKRLRSEAVAVFSATCFWCEKTGTESVGPDGKPWSLDRLHVGKFGGKYSQENVVLSCMTCNVARGAKPIAEFAEMIGRNIRSFSGVDGWGASAGHPSGDTRTPGGRQPDTGGVSAGRLHLNRTVKPSVPGTAEGALFQVNGDLPPPLNTPEIREAWESWLRTRSQKRKKPSDEALRLQVRALLAMGPQRALAALRHSARNDYTGIHEPKASDAPIPATRKITKENAL